MVARPSRDLRQVAERRDEPPPTSDRLASPAGQGSGRYIPPMSYRSPSRLGSEGVFLRFPYFNPQAPLFQKNPLAWLAAGQRLEVPASGPFGLWQWGVSVGQEASLGPSSPVTARDDCLSSRSRPVEVGVSGSTWRIQLHLLETTVAGPDGTGNCRLPRPDLLDARVWAGNTGEAKACSPRDLSRLLLQACIDPQRSTAPCAGSAACSARTRDVNDETKPVN